MPGPQAEETSLSLSAQSSSDLSIKGKRFLKSKTPITTATTLATALVTPTVAPKAPETSYRAAMLLAGSKVPPQAVVSQGVTLDSDEEDMRQLLSGSFESPEDSLLRGTQSTTRKSFRKGSQKVSPSPPPAGRASSVRRLSRSPPSPTRRGYRPQAQQSPSLSVHSVILSPATTPPKTPSHARLGSLSSASDHSDVRSLEELFPEAPAYNDDISERSGVSDDFKINIMSLDDLAPMTLGDTERPAEQKPETPVSKHRTRAPGPQSLEEVSPGEKEEMLDYESDFESEVRTETDGNGSEISEHVGDEDEKEASEVGEVKDHDDSDSDRSRRRYDDDFASLSERSSRARSRSYATRTDRSRTAGSLSDGTISRVSRSLSRSDSSSRTITPPRRSEARPSGPAVREAAVQTQPDGLAYAWSSGVAALGPAVGMAYVDPTPVASHTISAEAVEALSAYSPAVFALNDMLRQQLSLTRHFVQASRHLHSSMLQTLGPADYTYTTLEDTKEFIRCHKPSRLTMEEALEEVLQEMREYHYI